MARPRKNTEQKKREGTYRKDRDQALKTNPNLDKEMLEVVKAKLVEIREAIRGADVKKDIVELGKYAVTYKRLADILSVYVPESEEDKKTIVDGLWKT